MHWSWQTANDVLLEAIHELGTCREEILGLLAFPERSRNPQQLLSRLGNKISEFLKTEPVQRANFRAESALACTAGTIAHEFVTAWIEASKSQKNNVSDEWSIRQIAVRQNVSIGTARQARSSIDAFLDWVEQNRFELTHTEVPLTSRRYLYGGCLDSLGLLNHRRYKDPITKITYQDKPDRLLFDWKTSKAVYGDYVCQLAAYVMLWDENYPDDPIKRCSLLRFDKATGDFSEHQFTNLDDAKELFLLYRRCYDLSDKVSKRIK